ncbi:MAG: protoporphyrinogen oxidase, partial [Chloroflexota bacterium]
MPQVTIIGGGIAGLATAFYLQQLTPPDASINYSVIESSPHFGGKVVTDVVDSFVIEGGPDSFLTQKPWAKTLCLELGLADRLIPTNDHKRNVFFLNNGKLVPFPGGFRLTIPTEVGPFLSSPLISPLGKLRMGLDWVVPARRDSSDESLATFVRRRLGQEALDKIAGPMMAGIYMADPERLSIQSTFPTFAEMERKNGSLIRAMQSVKKEAAKKRGDSAPPPMFLSLKGGMNELINTLVEKLEGSLYTNCR